MPEFTMIGFLRAADEARRYVKRQMTIGASNDIWKALDKWIVGNVPALFCVSSMRSEIDRTIKNGKVQSFNTNRIMEIEAKAAESHGCGNCGEQSALAFFYLRGKGVEPLDWVHFTNRDHAFVLLNVPAEPASAPKDWKKGVVLCDPYYQRSGPWTDFSSEYDLSVIASLLRYANGVTL